MTPEVLIINLFVDFRRFILTNSDGKVPAWKQKQLEEEERKKQAARDEQRRKEEALAELKAADRERV